MTDLLELELEPAALALPGPRAALLRLARAAAGQFGLSPRDKPLLRKRRRESALFVLGTGEARQVLRLVPLGPDGLAQARFEVDLLTALAGRSLPVPTARGPVEPAPGIAATLLGHLPGRLASQRVLPAQLRALGRTLGLLHGATARLAANGALPRPVLAWNAARLSTALDTPLARSFHPGPELARARGLLRAVQDAERRLGNAPQARGVIHADCHLGNVVFQAGVAQLIDFAQAGEGPWLLDLAVPLADLVWDDDPRLPELRPALVAGYLDTIPWPMVAAEQIGSLLDPILAMRLLDMACWPVTLMDEDERRAGGAELHEAVTRALDLALPLAVG